jgi:hypothetical protein
MKEKLSRHLIQAPQEKSPSSVQRHAGSTKIYERFSTAAPPQKSHYIVNNIGA